MAIFTETLLGSEAPIPRRQDPGMPQSYRLEEDAFNNEIMQLGFGLPPFSDVGLILCR